MKKAIIVGATSGIGKALAEILLQEGYVVGITGRREELLRSMRQKHGEKVFPMRMDVQELSTLAPTCDEILGQLGGLDLLIIAAGAGEENKDLDFEVENHVIKTNIQGFTCIADWGMNFFKKQGRGHLVNISSVAGIRGNGLAPSYNATKAYQVNYFEGLRLNADRSNATIYVTDIRPGFVDTAMAKGEGMFWVAPVEKAAKQIYAAILRKKKVAYITKRWRLIGWLLKPLPYSILKKL